MLQELATHQCRFEPAAANLLDPRVEDGDDEESNIEVGRWGCDDESALPSGRAWHDETGAALGGLDLEAAARLSGTSVVVIVVVVAAIVVVVVVVVRVVCVADER